MRHSRRRHEVVDHTADARIRAQASTLPGLFEEAAAALDRLVGSPELRQRLGRSAREWVSRERSWSAG